MPNRSHERIELYGDIFTDGIESGISHWAQVSTYKWMNLDPRDYYAIIHEWDDENDEYFAEGKRVDFEVIVKGFNLLDKESREGLIGWKYMDTFFKNVRAGNWDEVDYDASIADMIIQTGLLGAVVYG
jgi:hypothetical protein